MLRLSVLSKHRLLDISCHEVNTTVDPFASWRHGDGFFNKVTKTWIYQPKIGGGWEDHSSNTNPSPSMGWNNINFPADCYISDLQVGLKSMSGGCAENTIWNPIWY